MGNDSAVTAPPPPDRTAQRILRDLIDGKRRGTPTGPESLVDILRRVMPIVHAACAEQNEPSEPQT